MKRSGALLSIVALAVFLALAFCAEVHAENWAWKKSTTPEDVMSFLNGSGAYAGNSAKDARICAVNKGSYLEFFVFYQGKDRIPGGWAWKKATTPDDVMNFLNGTGAYTGGSIKDARVCAVDKGSYLEFYVFYQGRERTPGNWAWKKATIPDDVMNFLNGSGAYQTPVKQSEVCAVSKGSSTEYYVFYRK